MRKIIIHIEEINARSEKIQFQIKLPVTAHCVTGILATVNPNSEGIPVEGEEDPHVKNTGALWLRIPEHRDVFFADDVKENNHVQRGWWFTSWKHNFLSINVPIEDTIIEGFYVDETPPSIISYLLKIYIELETND